MSDRGTDHRQRDRRRQGGAALFVVVFLILLLGAMALDVIGRSETDSTAGGRSRSSARALHAADAGLQLAAARLSATPSDTNPIDVAVGAGISVQSRNRGDATPQPLVSLGPGPPPDGYEIGGDTGFVSEVFLVDMIANSSSRARVELQGKLNRFSGASGGY